jgi:hypothetical protein
MEKNNKNNKMENKENKKERKLSFVSCNQFLQAKLNIVSINSMKYYILSCHTQIYPLLQVFCKCA